MSSQNLQFFILEALSLEPISIDELGSIASKLYSYAMFFLRKFIFHKNLQVEVGYRFSFCLVYYRVVINEKRN